MITFKQKGDFKKLNGFLEKAKNLAKIGDLDKYGREGVRVLTQATPVDTGKTASSWDYHIERSKNRISVVFTNDNIQNGVPIAIILQYGHATGEGGYVSGKDYINPAIRPVFDKLADDAWKEVTKS